MIILIRFNLFKGCPQAKTCTIIIRGGAEQFMEETERSLHDAIMIVRRAKKNDAVVAGTKQTIFEFHLVLIYFRFYLNFC
jgi:chaperonin GroEL (HSP60 family)